MVPTFDLPEGVSVSDISARVREALDELASLEPTKIALGHWLCGAYRRTLVVGDGTACPFTLRVSSDLAAVIADAKEKLVAARRAASDPDGDFLATLPKLVHVVRIRDAYGHAGFAPLEIRGASLGDRAISVLLADFLTSPERYSIDTAA